MVAGVLPVAVKSNSMSFRCVVREHFLCFLFIFFLTKTIFVYNYVSQKLTIAQNLLVCAILRVDGRDY